MGTHTQPNMPAPTGVIALWAVQYNCTVKPHRALKHQWGIRGRRSTTHLAHTTLPGQAGFCLVASTQQGLCTHSLHCFLQVPPLRQNAVKSSGNNPSQYLVSPVVDQTKCSHACSTSNSSTKGHVVFQPIIHPAAGHTHSLIATERCPAVTGQGQGVRLHLPRQAGQPTTGQQHPLHATHSAPQMSSNVAPQAEDNHFSPRTSSQPACRSRTPTLSPSTHS